MKSFDDSKVEKKKKLAKEPVRGENYRIKPILVLHTALCIKVTKSLEQISRRLLEAARGRNTYA